MKILINGNEIKDMLNVNNQIIKLKKNKRAWKIVIISVALLVDSSTLSLATDVSTFQALEKEIGDQFKQIIDLILFIINYACMGAGLKEVIITAINGGGAKDAIFNSLNYWLLSGFSRFFITLF